MTEKSSGGSVDRRHNKTLISLIGIFGISGSMLAHTGASALYRIRSIFLVFSIGHNGRNKKAFALGLG